MFRRRFRKTGNGFHLPIIRFRIKLAIDLGKQWNRFRKCQTRSNGFRNEKALDFVPCKQRAIDFRMWQRSNRFQYSGVWISELAMDFSKGATNLGNNIKNLRGVRINLLFWILSIRNWQSKGFSRRNIPILWWEEWPSIKSSLYVTTHPYIVDLSTLLWSMA